MKNEELNILIIEDVESDAELALAALRRAGMHYDARRVEEADALVRALGEFRPDVILSDFAFPNFDGYAAIEIVRRLAPDVPLVFVSGTIGEERAIELLKLGATDYVLKDNLTRLPTAVSRAITEARDRKRGDDMLHLRNRAIEASLHAIVITNALVPDHPIEYVNAAFERITGYSREESLGRNCRFLQGDDNHQPGIALIAAAVSKDKEVHAVLRNYRKNGSLFWNEVHIAPVRDGAGRITHHVGFQNDVSERVEREARIEYLATHDELTGLPNRRLLEDRAGQAIIHSRRTGRAMALAMLDLDRFKLINDSRGHPFGDRLLVEVANRLSSAVRRGDTVARLGGDEFIVLMTDLAQRSDAITTIGKLHAALTDPLELDGTRLFVSASIGVSIYPDDGDDVAVLLKHADTALYRAKDQGRDMVAFYTPNMSKLALDRMLLEDALRLAIEREQLEVHYQPQIALRSGRLLGVEALLRWSTPELGSVPPGRFIPVAEDTGLILPIGNWVIETACAQARAWADAGLDQLRVAVNLSPKQFRQHDLVSRIKTALERAGLPARKLELELTEGMLIEDPDRAEAVLRQLRTLGVRVAIDDFGTGYASLSYLQRFVADLIKIDQSFVRTIVSDPQSAAIARAVISLGHSLQLNVLAEGVETPEQLAFLREAGCDEAQGYLIARPMPVKECTAFLESWQGFEDRPGDDTPTVLIVDDEESILSALQRCLRREGYRILTATSPSRAFELLASSQVSVVISDCRMSGMSGTEFLDRVRQIHPLTVRILLTGYTELSSVIDAVNRGGVFRFVTKPWDNDELRATIRNALKQYAQLQELAVVDPMSQPRIVRGR